MNIGDILVWSLRLSLIGVCLYALRRQNRSLLEMGVSGIAGSLMGWGLVETAIGNRFYGISVFVIGLGLFTAANIQKLLFLRARRKGRRTEIWFQINDQKFQLPPGTREVDVYLEFIRTANPALKVEKTVAPKKGEKEEDYKERMR